MKRLAVVLIALLLFVAPAQAAIAFDASAQGTLSTSTFNVTIGGGSDRLLTVGCWDDDGAADLTTAVKWNTSESLTFIAHGQTNTDRWFSLWYLLNPTSGTHAVAVTTTSAFYQCAAIALSGVGALDTSTTDTPVLGSSASTTITVAANAWIVSFVKENTGSTATWTNATEREVSGGLHMADSNGPLSGSQTTQVAGTGFWGMVSASFTPAGGGGGGGNTGRLLLLGVGSP